jgi:hypothetical protein
MTVEIHAKLRQTASDNFPSPFVAPSQIVWAPHWHSINTLIALAWSARSAVLMT